MMKVACVEEKIVSNTFLEERDEYIHYVEKVDKLKEDKMKKESAGGTASKSLMEKIVRVAAVY